MKGLQNDILINTSTLISRDIRVLILLSYTVLILFGLRFLFKNLSHKLLDKVRSPLITDQMKNIMLTASLFKSVFSRLWELATPKNITYFWGFGRLLGLIMIIQVMSGFFLAFYYVRGSLAWDSVVEITREVNYGWLLRVIHSNSASFVFVVLFIHFLRGILQASFYLAGPWIRGWIIILLTIAAAFLGYVLPWGQISFWGATVIINLLRVLPIGKLLVIWLWGGFYVSFFTCSFFYAAHFLLPFLVLGIAGVHLILLHFRGRNAPAGLRRLIKIKFTHLFLYKDIVNITLLWIIWMLALDSPDWSADPVNFIPRDLSSSPIHIQPEWYFLHLYAVLRSIPNKLGGLIGFALAILILRILSLVRSIQRMCRMQFFPRIIWRFISLNIILMWLGSQPVEDPYIYIGQTITTLYFLVIFLILIYDRFLNRVLD